MSATNVAPVRGAIIASQARRTASRKCAPGPAARDRPDAAADPRRGEHWRHDTGPCEDEAAGDRERESDREGSNGTGPEDGGSVRTARNGRPTRHAADGPIDMERGQYDQNASERSSQDTQGPSSESKHETPVGPVDKN